MIGQNGSSVGPFSCRLTECWDRYQRCMTQQLRTRSPFNVGSLALNKKPVTRTRTSYRYLAESSILAQRPRPAQKARVEVVDRTAASGTRNLGGAPDSPSAGAGPPIRPTRGGVVPGKPRRRMTPIDRQSAAGQSCPRPTGKDQAKVTHLDAWPALSNTHIACAVCRVTLCHGTGQKMLTPARATGVGGAGSFPPKFPHPAACDKANLGPFFAIKSG